jgi:hypothetical protein
MVKRGKAKRADYILYYKQHIPLAVIDHLFAVPSASCGVGPYVRSETVGSALAQLVGR